MKITVDEICFKTPQPKYGNCHSHCPLCSARLWILTAAQHLAPRLFTPADVWVDSSDDEEDLQPTPRAEIGSLDTREKVDTWLKIRVESKIGKQQRKRKTNQIKNTDAGCIWARISVDEEKHLADKRANVEGVTLAAAKRLKKNVSC